MSFRSIRTGLRALRTRTPVMTRAAAALLLAAAAKPKSSALRTGLPKEAEARGGRAALKEALEALEALEVSR